MIATTRRKQKQIESENTFDIIRGARENDIEEIEGALAEDPRSISHVDESTEETALHIAVRLRHIEATELLLGTSGVDLRAEDFEGADVLAASAQGGHPYIMNLVAYALHPELKQLRLEPDPT